MGPPEGKDYKWYISGIYCQLGDGLCHLPPFRGTRNNHRFYTVFPCLGTCPKVRGLRFVRTGDKKFSSHEVNEVN